MPMLWNTPKRRGPQTPTDIPSGQSALSYLYKARPSNYTRPIVISLMDKQAALSFLKTGRRRKEREGSEVKSKVRGRQKTSYRAGQRDRSTQRGMTSPHWTLKSDKRRKGI